MKDFKITKLELLNLCLEADIYPEIYLPELETDLKFYEGIYVEVENVLNEGFSLACLKRNLCSTETVELWNKTKSLGGVFNSIGDFMKEFDYSKDEAEEVVKDLLINESLNAAFFEQLNKKLVNKKTGECYVPESLWLNFFISHLGSKNDNWKLIIKSNKK